MIPLKLVMTTAGLRRFTAAQENAGVDLRVAKVGFSNTNFVAAPTLTALPGEFRRIDTVSGESVGDNVVHMTVQDEDEVTYTVRGFGLWLGDGTLFATYSQPTPIAEKSTASMLALVIDIVFPEAGVDRIIFGDTNFLNPPATTERKGVVELATLAEAKAGDALRAVTGAVVKAMIGDTVPIGTILLWAGIAAPAGWAICNGQSVNRTDGLGLIATPDLRGRVAVGVSADHALGTGFGATTREVDTTSAGDHDHAATGTIAATATGVTVSSTSRNVDAGGSAGGVLTGVTVNDPGHTHTVEVDVATAGGHAHAVTIDVTQPSVALHYIMKV
ncbi:phage tail protein [Sphingomonadaceae bacterium OTU29MARTA1]|nr:phage tail protein [Sphingomonadaceae bacterium OTU29MARTA1]